MSNWVSALDDDDRAEMLSELRAATDLLEGSGDPRPLEAALAAWKATGEALSDPDRRAVLTGQIDPGDFIEVPRP